MEKGKNMPEYIYDTPIGIVQKEGAMCRGMGTYDPDRATWVRVIAIIFALGVFLFPGISLMVVAIGIPLESGLEWNMVLPMVALIILGLFFTYAGVVVVRSNIKRKNKV
jgi:hypothetical protein